MVNDDFFNSYVSGESVRHTRQLKELLYSRHLINGVLFQRRFVAC